MAAGTMGGLPAAVQSAAARSQAPGATPAATPVHRPAAGEGPRVAYVGAYTRERQGGGSGVSVFDVAPDTGVLALRQTVPSDNPSFLALDPTGRFLYAVNEVDDFGGRPTGSVEAYAIDPASGSLAPINRQDSGGADPAHLAVDPSGRFLAVANYSGGTFTVLPIRADGGLDPVVSSVTQTGSGPDRERQEAPHPHAVVFDPTGRRLAAADLGTDRIRLFHLDIGGELVPTGEVSLAPGAGPRHLAFHPDGSFLFVINELDATITAFAYDAADGRIGAEVQTVPTLPADFSGPRSTAEIAVHPSGRYLYGSNRREPGAASPEADSIVAYAIDRASGALSPIGHATEGISVPRGFGFDPSGSRLYVCNQQGDSIVQFGIEPATGALAPTSGTTRTPTPVCIVFGGA